MANKAEKAPIQEGAPSREDGIRKLAEMIRGVQVAMMTTLDKDGRLHSRPMATQEAPFDGTLWFFTEASSPKADELERDHRIELSYAKASDQCYVTVSGTGRLIRDSQKARELWTPAMRAWFPQGVDDPNLALIQVDVERAEFWDTKSSPVVHAIGLVKAMVTGRRPSDKELGDHQKLDLAG